MDIAARAGVSQPTVSFVLNGQLNSRISAQTRDKVLAAAQDLGYIKRPRANGSMVNSTDGAEKVRSSRSLQEHNKESGTASVSADMSTKKQNYVLESTVSEEDGAGLNIALILDGAMVTNDHFICAIQAAIERSRELQVNLAIMSATLTAHSASERSLARDTSRQVMQELSGPHYDGVIIASSLTRELPENVVINNKPLVYLNCVPATDSSALAVIPDDFNGAYSLAEKLVTHYTRPHIIAGDEWMKATMDRTRAIVCCYGQHSIPIRQCDITYTNWSFRACFNAVIDLLSTPAPAASTADAAGSTVSSDHSAAQTADAASTASAVGTMDTGCPGRRVVKERDQRPDILYCASDFLATAAYQAIYYLGLRIPEDIAVAGYDNQILSTELCPALTTVSLPYTDMGEMALDLICSRIKRQQSVPKKQSDTTAAAANTESNVTYTPLSLDTVLRTGEDTHVITVPGTVMLRSST